jgi:hypothetical protein
MKNRLVRRDELASDDADAMFLLLDKHFQGAKREVFEEDLINKNWIILLYGEDNHQLQGFSTLLLYNTEFEGDKISIVYSGDTIVDPSAWTSSALARSWVAAVNELQTRYSQGKLYWLLISGGYRTYRFLPVFGRDFYPRYDMKTPDKISRLMHFLAKSRFGKNYDNSLGIVRFPNPHILREGLHGIPSERLHDPHINFFQQQNPGHIYGDELVCLTEISEANLTAAGKRLWFGTGRKGNISRISQPKVIPIPNIINQLESS